MAGSCFKSARILAIIAGQQAMKSVFRKIGQASVAALFLILCLGCKKTPTTTTAPTSEQSAISVACNPSSAGPDTTVVFTISIKGNIEELRVFGGDMTFDTKMFQFQDVRSGSLTGNWAAVDGNEVSSGTLKVGGFVGNGTAVPKASTGTLAEVRFKVTGASYGNGQTTQVCIQQYTDGLVEFKPDPACSTFSLKK
jgi:hypothetical protein